MSFNEILSPIVRHNCLGIPNVLHFDLQIEQLDLKIALFVEFKRFTCSKNETLKRNEKRTWFVSWTNLYMLSNRYWDAGVEEIYMIQSSSPCTIKRILRYVKGTSNAAVSNWGSDYTIRGYVDLWLFWWCWPKVSPITSYVFTLVGFTSWLSKL